MLLTACRTALHFATETGHWQRVRHIVYSGARVDLESEEIGLTALNMAHKAKRRLTNYTERPWLRMM